ncbi:MAG: hypothetical protein WC253_03300 [Sulfurovaceae bacterium]
MKNLSKQVDYISQLLNIKTESELVILDIGNKLSQLDDPADFIVYLRKNYNHYHTTYLTGFQKFLYLLELYKNKTISNKGVDEIKLMAEKINIVSRLLGEHTEANFEDIFSKDANGKLKYFTQREIEILSLIGNLGYCIRLQKSVSGTDALETEIHNKILNLGKDKNQILLKAMS